MTEEVAATKSSKSPKTSGKCVEITDTAESEEHLGSSDRMQASASSSGNGKHALKGAWSFVLPTDLPSQQQPRVGGGFKARAARIAKDRASFMASSGLSNFLASRPLRQSVPSFCSDVAQNSKHTDAAKYRGDLWTACFNIRLQVNDKEQYKLLRKKHFVNGDPEPMEDGRCARLCNLLEGHQVTDKLKLMAIISMVATPLQFALEPMCMRSDERSVILVLKALHLAVSLVYLILASAQFWALIVEPVLKSKGLFPVWWRFLLDIVAQCGTVAEVVHLSEEPSRVPSAAQVVILLHFLKVWRVFFPPPNTVSVLQSFTIQITQLFLWLVFCAHSASCVFLTVAMFEVDNGKDTWMDGLYNGLEADTEHGCVDFYSAAVYFCTYTLSSIGYGDIVPVNAVEQLVCVFFMLGSQMFAAKIFADLTWITATHHYWKAQHHARLTQTAAALDSMEVHSGLRHRVLAYQDFIEEEQRERRAQECLRDLSRPLREEIKLVVYYDLVVKAPFLQEQPAFLVRMIVASLQDVVYLPCDVIIRMGDVGSELYFLRNGRAAVFKTPMMPEWHEEEIFVLKKGAYFGEVALLTGQPRTSWVIARTYCICSILSKQVIDEIMNKHPQCIARLVASLKNALFLTPSVLWPELEQRVRKEFPSEKQLYQFTCSGEDGEAAAGLVTWSRFDLLMSRLHVSTLDRKLLWVEMDSESVGMVLFTTFMEKVRDRGIPETVAETGSRSGMRRPGMPDNEEDDENGSSDDQSCYSSTNAAAMPPPPRLPAAPDYCDGEPAPAPVPLSAPPRLPLKQAASLHVSPEHTPRSMRPAPSAGTGGSGTGGGTGATPSGTLAELTQRVDRLSAQLQDLIMHLGRPQPDGAQ